MHKEPACIKKLNTADWDVDAAEKGGYEHFMLKEIHEQPTAVKTTITPRLSRIQCRIFPQKDLMRLS